MIEIECLVYGKPVKIPQYIDPDSYDGQVVCQEYKSLLHVKLVGAKVRKYKVVEKSKREGEIRIISHIPERVYPEKVEPEVNELKDGEDAIQGQD